MARGLQFRLVMKIAKLDRHAQHAQQGKIGWALAWLLGVPLPLLLIIYLFTRAC